jgi:hypothetical protein
LKETVQAGVVRSGVVCGSYAALCGLGRVRHREWGDCDSFVTLKQAEKKWQLGFLGVPHRVARR